MQGIAHAGYCKEECPNADSTNRRNSSLPKMLTTEVRLVLLLIPREHEGSLEPKGGTQTCMFVHRIYQPTAASLRRPMRNTAYIKVCTGSCY